MASFLGHHQGHQHRTHTYQMPVQELIQIPRLNDHSSTNQATAQAHDTEEDWAPAKAYVEHDG